VQGQLVKEVFLKEIVLFSERWNNVPINVVDMEEGVKC